MLFPMPIKYLLFSYANLYFMMFCCQIMLALTSIQMMLILLVKHNFRVVTIKIRFKPIIVRNKIYFKS